MDVQVMCALVANDPAKQTWLRGAGLLQVLHRLTLGAQSDGQDVNNDVSSALGEHVSLSVRRQCARILAILAQQQDALVRPDIIHDKPDKVMPCLLPHRTRLLPLLLSKMGKMGMQGSFQGSEWQRWLEVSAAVEDCKLASHARRATLNLQSARTVASAEVIAHFPESLPHKPANQAIPTSCPCSREISAGASRAISSFPHA